MKRFWFCASIFLMSGDTQAMTGAEFLQSDKTFAAGYALGIVDNRISLVWDNDTHFDRIRTCVLQSKMNSETLYYVASGYFQQNPSTLRESAVVGILNAINNMCK